MKGENMKSSALCALQRLRLPAPKATPLIVTTSFERQEDQSVKINKNNKELVEEEQKTVEEQMTIRLIQYAERSVEQVSRALLVGDENTTIVCGEADLITGPLFCAACKFANAVRCQRKAIVRIVGKHVVENYHWASEPRIDDALHMVRHLLSLENECRHHEFVWNYYVTTALALNDPEQFREKANLERTTLLKEILQKASWKSNVQSPPTLPIQVTPAMRRRARAESEETEDERAATGWMACLASRKKQRNKQQLRAAAIGAFYYPQKSIPRLAVRIIMRIPSHKENHHG